MIVNDEIQEMTRRFVEALHPQKVILFGSYAKESYTATSDYDFYIILPDGEYDLVDFTRRAYKSLRDMKDRLPVDILINTVSGFNRRCLMPTMEREAFREGIVLYGA